MSAPPTGAIVASRINKNINRFIRAEALTEQSAKTTGELGLRNGFLFRRLVKQGVFIETSGHRYYLNSENLAAYKQNRRKRALFVLIVIAAAILMMYLFAAQSGR